MALVRPLVVRATLAGVKRLAQSGRGVGLVAGTMPVVAGGLVATVAWADAQHKEEEKKPQTSSTAHKLLAGWLSRRDTIKTESEAHEEPLETTTTKEARTGVEFSDFSDDGLKLAGCGVRLKFGVVPVYAVALYAPRDVTIASKSDAVAELAAKAAAAEIRMRLVRPLDRVTFVKAIEEQVAKRVAPADAAQVTAFTEMCLRHLDALMPTGFAPALQLNLAHGRVGLVVEGELKGSMHAPAVATALLDVYLGPDTVSPSARRSILAGLLARGSDSS